MLSILSFGPAVEHVTMVSIGHVFYAAAFFFCIGMIAGLEICKRMMNTEETK